MDLTYLIGEPGVGKSTLAEFLTREIPFEETASPVPFRRYDAGVVELGIRRPDFPGTDAYPMDVQPRVIKFLGGMRPKLVFAEGDRLANMKFLSWCRDVLGYSVVVYCLWGSALAAKRREARGHVFDESWLKGRQTKVDKLAYSLTSEGFRVIALDADGSLGALVEQMDDPVSEALKLGRGAAVK